ncbi:hypothetical protein [Capnocytophaga sputigena]|uniref:DUF7738 domain-containing protein n=1 Tax=Capnocytophaga sputigena TaxID=1019 RepID=UPI0028E71C1D|nr:hypothetical protein [Capnocytophaga sputigena]
MINTDFQITECSALYKGKPLPFGKPIEEWEKIFGKVSRKKYECVYIWDDLGIAIENSTTTNSDPYDPSPKTRKYDVLYIFYALLGERKNCLLSQQITLKQWKNMKRNTILLMMRFGIN